MSVAVASGLAHVTAGEPQRPAILFLHGFMGSLADWRGAMEALQDRFYCVVVDLPGHGSSIRLPSGAYTIGETAQKILVMLGELKIGHTALVGYSMGGRLALYLALRHPARFTGLFLESASPGLESPEERKARRETDEYLMKRLKSEDFGRFLEDWYSQPLFASLARDEALLRRTVEARRKNDPAELAKSLRGLGTGVQPSLWGELPGLRIPALAVAGALDKKYVAISRRMARLGPSMESAMVPGAGHNVRAEAPEAYLASLRGFLAAL